MGASFTKSVVDVRSRLTPTLEKALKARDKMTSEQVTRHALENKDMAKKLNTKFTDPNALLTGFRRDEHQNSNDNEAWLRVSQGLPANAAPGVSTDSENTEMRPDLLEFLGKELYVESKEGKVGEQGKGRVRTVEEEESRPLPSLRTAPGPVVAPSLVKGTISGELLREILGVYHHGIDGKDAFRKIERRAADEMERKEVERKREMERGGEPGGIRKHSRLQGAMDNISSSDSSADDSSPSSMTLPEGWTEDVAIGHIVKEYGLKEEDVRVMMAQINIPEIVRDRLGGDIEGIWRIRGGREIE
mmetsp:Transcript_13830/g.28293  ORF Transcript_13830/g.28293 Transcript_13830/m.28293 type:complete len:303 (-) Transcript_13830:47-955(-)